MALPAEMNVLLSDVRPDKSFLDFSLAKQVSACMHRALAPGDSDGMM